MSIKRSQLRAEGFLVLVTLIWGSTFVVIKTGLSGASPLLFLGIRFSAAFIFFLPFLLKEKTAWNKRVLVYGLILGVFQFLGYSMQTLGLQYTTIAKSSLLTYVYALVAPPLQFIILKKKLRFANVLGLCIVMIGIYLFAAPENASLNKGDYLTLISAFSYGFYIIYLDKYTTRENPVLLTAIQFAVTAVVSFGLCLFLEKPFLIPSKDLFFSLGYLASFGSVGAIYIMNRFQRETTPTKAVVIYSLEPVFAVLLGFLIGGERISLTEIFAGLLILSGVLVSEIISLIQDKRT